ncbi:acyl-CoA dehydrogenase family protein [Legionella saoudiensis]|uniref:acyl-CoA dehydrogenase family protein n=1 Tax=Legionella saoudiensis TaxID=1750561 RepID=UPI000730B746|nr:acyl-CoA dehydrogenase [Legionella saoudiensis]
MQKKNVYLQLEIGKVLDSYLGSAHDENTILSFKNIRIADEAEEYPEHLLQHLYALDLQHYLLPKEHGGKLNNFEEMGFILRIISQRDLTLGLSFCMPFLGACPAWIAGKDEGLELAKNLIKQGHRIAMGLTEHEHGSDLLADECFAVPEGENVVINGKKWLINHSTKAHAYMVFVSENQQHGPRGYSFYLIDKQFLNEANFQTHGKIRTHGVRGADMGSFSFKQLKIPTSARIGKSGQGLEILLKVFNVTRSVAPCLALGATDTALRLVMQFTLERTLYGQPVFAIPHAQETMVHAFADYLLAECCSIISLRALNFFPEKMSLYSSICKYLVPTQCEAILADLAKILGARYYLRDEYYHGMFQKILRDVPLISFGDGNSLVNLHSILLQMTAVFGRNKQEKIEQAETFFNLGETPPEIDLASITLSCHGGDIIFNMLNQYWDVIRDYLHADAEVLPLLDELKQQIQAMVQWIQERPACIPYQEPYEWFIYGKKFCTLQAIASAVLLWFFNQKGQSKLLNDLHILKLLLIHTLHPTTPLPSNLLQHVAAELKERTEKNYLFSVYPFGTIHL